MRTRALGRSGIMVGEIGLGTWGLSGEAYGPVTDAEVTRALEAAVDEGVTFFETASCYARGRVESRLGEVLRGRGRERFVVSTRIGVDRAMEPAQKRFAPGEIARACDEALARLGTDRVDLLVLHNPRAATLAQGEATEALGRLKQAGKAVLTGASVGGFEAGHAAIAAGVDVLVLPYNLLYPRLLHALSGEIVTAGVGVVARSPLAYGVLAGTWGADRRWVEGDHRALRWNDADLARRVRQREVARVLVHGDVRSIREAALRYVLANGLVSVVVPGACTAEQVRQNAHAADALPYLPDDDLARIGQLMANAGVEL